MTAVSEVTANNCDWPCVKGVTGVNDSDKWLSLPIRLWPCLQRVAEVNNSNN